MPRCIDIILRNEGVEKAKAGDKCLFTGNLIVIPDVYQMFSNNVEAVLEQPNEEQKKKTDNKSTNSNWTPNEGITGLKVLGVRDLNYKLCFLCNNVESIEGNFRVESEKNEENSEMFIQSLSQEDLTKIMQMKEEKEIYKNLYSSLAPNIYGHENVKKGILLMLLGGVHKVFILIIKGNNRRN
jgi:DNA replication licensing factor MCM6